MITKHTINWIRLIQLAACAILCALSYHAALGAVPQSAQIAYREQNFGVGGSMNWQQDGKNYQLALSINIPFFSLAYQSSGLIDNSYGLHPLLFQEIRNGNVKRDVKFDWDKHQLIYQNNASCELKEGAQDLLSLSWQLALNKAANSAEIQLTNGSKVYYYAINSSQKAKLNGLNAQVFRSKYGEESVEIWLASDYANVPIRIIFNKPNHLSLDLQATTIAINNQTVWQINSAHAGSVTKPPNGLP